MKMMRRIIILVFLTGILLGCSQDKLTDGNNPILTNPGKGTEISAPLIAPVTPESTIPTGEAQSSAPSQAGLPVATGVVYFVSPVGSDTNLGTEEYPWKSIQYAVRSLQAGDIALIRGGVYNEFITISGKIGTQEAPIILQAYPGEHVIVSTTDWAGAVINGGSAWVVLDGFQFTNAPSDGVNLTNSEHITLQNCASYNNGGIGIHISSSHGPANNNIVRNCDVHDNREEGIYLDIKTANLVPVDNNIIENNRVYNNAWEGIQNTNQNGVDPRPNGTIIRGNQVENNGADWATLDLSGNQLVIQDNYVSNKMAPAGGIYYSNGSGTLISRNTVKNSYIQSDLGDAIVLRNVSDILVEENKIISLAGATQLGINIVGSSSKVVFKNNYITTNQNAIKIIRAPFKEFCLIIKLFEYCQW